MRRLHVRLMDGAKKIDEAYFDIEPTDVLLARVSDFRIKCFSVDVNPADTHAFIEASNQKENYSLSYSFEGEHD